MAKKKTTNADSKYDMLLTLEQKMCIVKSTYGIPDQTKSDQLHLSDQLRVEPAHFKPLSAGVTRQWPTSSSMITSLKYKVTPKEPESEETAVDLKSLTGDSGAPRDNVDEDGSESGEEEVPMPCALL